MENVAQIPEELKIFRMEIEVGPDAIDVLKHTNNKVYLEWMENAAMEHSTVLGWGINNYLKLGSGFVAAAHHIEYLRPTHLGDKLTMYTWVQDVGRKTSLRRFALMRGSKICLVGATIWAFVDFKTGRGIEIPENVRASFPVLLPEDPIFQKVGVDLKPEYRLNRFVERTHLS